MRPSIPTPAVKRTEALLRMDSAREDLYNHANPQKALQSGKVMARAWARALPEEERYGQVQSFIYFLIKSYWTRLPEYNLLARALPLLPGDITPEQPEETVLAVAEAIGAAAACLEVIEASYQIGNIYTALLPESMRASHGIFYTPPELTARLIDSCTLAGVNWATAHIVDPACGGGAFLAPVCLKVTAALKGQEPSAILEHIQTHVTGLEIDPFGGWLSQVFAEVSLAPLIRKSGRTIGPLVRTCDSLTIAIPAENEKFDLVIGNPPYGKLKLSDDIRIRFRDSLYGHPNYYGLFTHLSLELTKSGGVIGLLTPTSFLSGEYFKQLRHYIRQTAIPVEMDFVSFRKGVFEDVLQETMLAVYQKKTSSKAKIKVNQLISLPGESLRVQAAGNFPLPDTSTAPWILPRTPEQAAPVNAMKKMKFRLKDWGYQVSTGPLVWNRHKDQLSKQAGTRHYPVIWAESISADGKFAWRYERKNHLPYFRFTGKDQWLLTTKSCILLQRTTAKEQDKRLIAAALPDTLLKQYGGVVVENHINMLLPILEHPPVSAELLAVFLNSRAANEAFRSITGSVAVSAYELESFPLPHPKYLKELNMLAGRDSSPKELEEACQKIYNLIK